MNELILNFNLREVVGRIMISNKLLPLSNNDYIVGDKVFMLLDGCMAVNYRKECGAIVSLGYTLDMPIFCPSMLPNHHVFSVGGSSAILYLERTELSLDELDKVYQYHSSFERELFVNRLNSPGYAIPSTAKRIRKLLADVSSGDSNKQIQLKVSSISNIVNCTPRQSRRVLSDLLELNILKKLSKDIWVFNEKGFN